MAKITDSIRDWYEQTYPTDEMIEYISEYATFDGLFDTLDNYGDVYEYIFVEGVADSIVRERIFYELASILRVDYNYIYEQWLKCV